MQQLDTSHKWSVLRFVAMSRDWYKKRLPTPHAGGEKAMAMTSDWKFNVPNRHVVNIPNEGLIPNLPSDSIVEVAGYFHNGKMRGVHVGALPEEIAEIVAVHARNQRSVVEAAWKGDKDLLLKVMLRDPMCAFIEDSDAVQDMMNLMLYYERRWLPNFEDILTEGELRKRRWVSPRELATKEKALKVKFPPNETLKMKAWPQIG